MPDDVLAVADPAGDLSRLWHVPVTPFFVMTDGDGVVRRKGAGMTGIQVESLFDLPTPGID